MIDLGFYSSFAAFLLAILAIVFACLAARGREPFLPAARHAVIAMSFFTSLAALGIVYAFVIGDFQLEYVWGNSDRDMPIFYKLGALWGGQSGSILFWSWLLSLYSMLVVLRHRKEEARFMGPVLATLMVVQAFFLALVVFASSPFRRADFMPPDGVGLNPLLQHPAMVIHPPCLYLGLIGFTIPFAFAIGALVSGRLGNEWMKKARLWAMVAWLFLGAGNILGGWWAYLELGWGGYWAWDPVENAAFMPWLAGTAYIHSAMIQERKHMLRIWNMLLILTTFLLTIFGTFITRSGMISSVHSFAQSPVGYWFAGFLVVATVVSMSLLFWRRNALKSKQHLDSFFSRESSFLLNNLILLGGAFAVLSGTLAPMFIEAIRGTRISLGPPVYNFFMIPIGLALLLLMGLGPLVPWRRATWVSMRRMFAIPTVLALIAATVLLVLGVNHAYALVTFSFCAFVLWTISIEFYRGIRARRSSSGESSIRAFFQLFTKGQRRYAGYIVHLGVVIIFIGFAGAAFTDEAETTLGRGETWAFRNYELTFRGLAVSHDASAQRVAADILVEKDRKPHAILRPRKDFYPKSEQTASEVAIHGTLGSDLYLVLASYDDETERASLKLYWNPLVTWYWIGGMVMVFGGLLGMVPLSRRRAAQQATSRAAAAAAVLVVVLILCSALVGSASTAWAKADQLALERKILNPCENCGGKPLAGSFCGTALELKAEVTTLVDRGMSEDEVLSALMVRYGESILAQPPRKGFNLFVWIIPIAGILAGAGGLVTFLRRARGTAPAMEARTLTAAGTLAMAAPHAEDAPDGLAPYRERLRRELAEE